LIISLSWLRLGSFPCPFSFGPITTFHVTCPHSSAFSWTYTLQPWRWRQYIPPKCRYPAMELRDDTIQ
jgi:hypothetical protein